MAVIFPVFHPVGLIRSGRPISEIKRSRSLRRV